MKFHFIKTIVFRAATVSVLSLLFMGCVKDDTEIVTPYSITITNINGIPENVTFDRIQADIIGKSWSIIGNIHASYKNGEATIILPLEFSKTQLQEVDRRNGMEGHWPAMSSVADALVASLGDFIAYQGEKRVGRVFLTDWDRKGSSSGKTFVYYQYADREFELTGSNSSYYYSNCFFDKGWNAYANVNPATDGTKGNIRCTTLSPLDLSLLWQFESRAN